MTTFNKFHQLKREINFRNPLPGKIEQDFVAPAFASSALAAPAPVAEAEMPEPTSPIHLIVGGQCTFIFKYKGDPAIASANALELSFTTKGNQEAFRLVIDAEEVSLQKVGKKIAVAVPGILPDKYAYYWLSIDTCNQWIRYGVGEARLETQRLRYAIGKEDLERFKEISGILPTGPVEAMRLLRDPIVETVPLAVKSMDRTTMNDIAQNRYLPKAALPAMCQKLYETIGGAAFVLDDDDFPEFSQAVKYSIETKGCWCHTKLEEKATEFGGKNEKEVYLRITLGSNGGESPGIPFVMEIWPPECYSPVHDHAGANAVIRVLHGQINVTLFPYLRPTLPEPDNPESKQFSFANKTFLPGDITWISPVLNQVHQLRNLDPKGGQPCITIQCYMYDEGDTGHYPYFDYSDDHGVIQQFAPDSDMDFVAFKVLMQQEWEARKR